MNSFLKRKFTKWYVRRGYTFGYDSNKNAYWKCPKWAKPLLAFFSPSLYYAEIFSFASDSLCAGFERTATKLAEDINSALFGGNKRS